VTRTARTKEPSPVSIPRIVTVNPATGARLAHYTAFIAGAAAE
jgi:hypothetical protein